ncbi:hypothetical protein ACQKL5_13925 [Peribacillus sp. NPDC097675]|uniref:hypothetical protein n=1 Tax=Peribacillus sp. NPDC097675 TaxID=3390618 RepID=UPI003CFDBC11
MGLYVNVEFGIGGIMLKSKIVYMTCCLCLLVISGCTLTNVQESEETEKVSVPDNTPSLMEHDLDGIDWTRQAVEFNTATGDKLFGNENRLAFIGPALKANKVNKWLWHFWGIEKSEATFVGYKRNTSKICPVLSDGEWSRSLTGSTGVNGAEMSMPSNVMLPEAGEWAILVYSDGELFDTLVVDVKEK